MESKISRREFAKTGTLATLGLLVGCSVRNQFNIVIKNGMVLDGSGSQAIRKDLGIIGTKIVAIDDLSTATSDQIIDADGLIIAPGFIDIHTHTDIELIVNPMAESKICQGVTTEVAGNCGASPFPLNDEDFSEMDKNVLESYDLHITWKDINGFLQVLNEKKISINYATFTGHGRLRSYIIGKNDIQPTPEQLERMKQSLVQSMENGSFGLSTGLEYAPGSYASTEELIELCKVVSKYNGVYATHMRNEDDRVEEAIQEALHICKETDTPLQISHFKACNQSNWHKVDSMLETIHNAVESGMPVTVDRYPYIAYGTGLTTFLPLWSRQGSTDEILARLQDKSLLSKIQEYAESRGERIGGWDRVVISSCFSEKNKIWEGITIQECATADSKSPFEFIRNLLLEERNRANIVGFAMNEDNLKKILSSSSVMIGSDGSAVAPYGKLSEGKPHPRYYGTFPRVLGKYCREEKLFDLATAIKKMTSMPAKKLGLQKRGIIQEGYYADITIFNPQTVIDNATFIEPHQFPTGIEYVIVNGKVTVKNGKHTEERAGKVIRHNLT
ncbi:MAG: D-aminoacylase [bacterium]|nr:MAG: D-aminoacylase [bacterium]